MRKIGVSIIGYGMSGKIFHLPPLIKHPLYEIVSILTNNPATIQELKTQYPIISVISSIEQALNDQKVDLIIVATPNLKHADYTKLALNSNKHVVVEKPFTETLKEATDLFKLAKEKKKVLRVFHNRQYDGDILTVHDVVKSEALGKVLSFTTRFDTYSPIVKNGWRDHEGVMPGVFYDLAPHLVDHCIRLFGIPERVYAKSYIDREGAVVDDHFEMTLYYDNLTCYLGAQKLDRNPLPRFQVIGTKATYVKYGFDNPDLIHYRGSTKFHEITGNSRLIFSNNRQEDEIVPVRMGEHYLFYGRLAEDIVNPKENDPEGLLAMAVVKIMELAKLSMKKNEEIKISSSVK